MEILPILSFYSSLRLVDYEKHNYQSIEKKHRIDFWIGIGTGTWSVAIVSTIIGFLASDYLNRRYDDWFGHR